MRASLFNVPITLDKEDNVFVLNTFTDAQAILSRDAAAFLARLSREDLALDEASSEERDAIETLKPHGFIVDSHEAERANVRRHFEVSRDDTEQLRVTVLTTLQCNFACDYCIQGDHGPTTLGQRMTADTVDRTAAWIEDRLDSLRPTSFVLTFFGGEPLLNLPAVYTLAERTWQACQSRGVTMLINVITNGLLLTPEVVERLIPFGLNGVKVTLDGDRDEHDQQRPLRGGQGTFDRIVDNIKHVAGKCRVAIGGNFESGSSASFLALLRFLQSQEFAPLLDKVTFKPVIRETPSTPEGIIPLTLIQDGTVTPSMSRRADKVSTSPCDTCHFVDEEMITLREATRAHGFRTLDGVHMGPCELHRRHAYTIGPEGTLYACPGFAGEADQAVGDIVGTRDERFARAAAHFERLSPWRPACGDCAFVPVCGGGCSVAAQAEQGDLHAPSCHKASFEAGVTTLAEESALTVGER